MANPRIIRALEFIAAARKDIDSIPALKLLSDAEDELSRHITELKLAEPIEVPR